MRWLSALERHFLGRENGDREVASLRGVGNPVADVLNCGEQIHGRRRRDPGEESASDRRQSDRDLSLLLGDASRTRQRATSQSPLRRRAHREPSESPQCPSEKIAQVGRKLNAHTSGFHAR